jgi:murein DD-endopeptidase MepM/ murein hydrolase activator NlpD
MPTAQVERPVSASVATPIIADFPVAPEEALPLKVTTVAYEVKPRETPCKTGRCLYMTPEVPKPGDMVMFETQAGAGTKDAMLSAYGRDVRMFRVGDRFRAFAGVPLLSRKKTYATRLWMTSAGEAEARTFACMEHEVRELPDPGSTPRLSVSRKYTKGVTTIVPTHQEPEGIELATAWVEALDREPFSQQLFLWPRPGDLNSGFGITRLYNGRVTRRHLGLDIQGAQGDRVFASQTGIVRFTGRQRATGNTVVIDHGAGVLTFYMHLSSMLKRSGEKVRQGELIGLVGRTGRVTGPHLHFAASIHGRFVDPVSVVDHPLRHDREDGLPCLADETSYSVR